MKKSTGDLLKSLKSARTYEEFLNKEISELNFGTLAEYLELLIASKNLKKSDIIVRGNLDKNYAYQLFNGTKTNPSRDKVLMLAFGMGLDYAETSVLLKNAKQPDLYVRDPRDSVIIFCLENHMTLIQANENLMDNGLKIME
ncbi:MAG: XRE family transcriptional regulator [Clostridia bacterium]|nr:XRE family transcriptional regulator [Clostridia bacterium]